MYVHYKSFNMGLDYYKILQVDRNANDDDLKKAYLKLGLEEEDDSKFKILSDAFDVLSDPLKRAAYDQEEGLKGQVPPQGAGTGGPNRNRFNPRDPFEIFQEFFGHQNPYSGGVRNVRSLFGNNDVKDNVSMPQRNIPFSFGNNGAKGNVSKPQRNVPFSFGNNGVKGNVSKPQRKGAAFVSILPCSLEDLYNGTTKKMKVSRSVTDATGRSTTISEILPIKINPGWKKGTKITFPERGNKQHGVIPSDVVFVIDEKPHSIFKRKGDDLIATQKISLAEASTGYTAQLTTLDGRSLTIPFSPRAERSSMAKFSCGISPINEEVVKGEGMPFPKEPTRKGNLHIKFDIK